LKGTQWKRPNDTVGLVEMLSKIGLAQRDFYNIGGLGILVGDGKLTHYGWESVLETYYNFELHKGINIAFDYRPWPD
jgi:high affinity Mn2+ porin